MHVYGALVCAGRTTISDAVKQGDGTGNACLRNAGVSAGESSPSRHHHREITEGQTGGDDKQAGRQAKVEKEATY